MRDWIIRKAMWLTYRVTDLLSALFQIALLGTAAYGALLLNWLEDTGRLP